MLRWLGDALQSSIGKKTVMSITGLLLFGFLINHIYGNLFLYSGEEAFDGYVAGLKEFGLLLYVAEAGLLLLFVSHIYMGVRVSLENREARGAKGYEVRNTRGKATVSSSTMLVSGLLLLAFLVKHLFDFRFDDSFHASPYARVQETLASPPHALCYVAGAAVLGFHLGHALKSALQTLGLSHPKFTPLVERAGIGLAVLFGVGFASFPLYYWLLGGGAH